MNLLTQIGDDFTFPFLPKFKSQKRPAHPLSVFLLFLLIGSLMIFSFGCKSVQPPASAPPPITQLSLQQQTALSALRAAQKGTFTSNSSPTITATAPVAAPPHPGIAPTGAPIPEAPSLAPVVAVAVSKGKTFLGWAIPIAGSAVIFALVFHYWTKIKTWLEKQKVLSEVEAYAKKAEGELKSVEAKLKLELLRQNAPDLAAAHVAAIPVSKSTPAVSPAPLVHTAAEGNPGAWSTTK